jgi:EH_Signature domain
MAQAATGNALAGSLEFLRLALHVLKAELQPPPVSAETRLRNLSEAVRSLDQTKRAKPAPVTAEYVDQWKAVVAGRRDDLEARAIRSLSWNPTIATDGAFQNYLARKEYIPNSQALQGMICSCHVRWSRELAVSEAVGRIRQHLRRYSGHNRLLNKWKDSASMMLGPKAHDLMGTELIKTTEGLAGFCDFWGMPIESSQLFHSAAEVASVICMEELHRVAQYRSFLFNELIPWQGWAPNMIKNVVGRLILLPKRDDVELIEAIIKIVRSDQRFGDPRNPQNHNNWIGMDDASRRMQEWLSAADITFFFESVLPRGKDPHGRKTFWLRYVGCRGLRSRPLLSSSDKFRLRDILSKKGANTSDYGRLVEEDTSAFILDFGPIMVIEFSAVGNACYLYEKKAAAEIVKDIWTTAPFSKFNLKRPSRIATAKPIRHDQQNRWKHEMESILARYGVRAVS